MDILVLSLFLYAPYLIGFVLVQFALLQGPNRRRVRPLSYWGLAWRAACGVAAGLVVGGALGFAVMFGPAYASGDFIGVPWLTMLPALGVFLGAGFATSSWLARRLVLRATPDFLHD
jgi:hypothetical protein